MSEQNNTRGVNWQTVTVTAADVADQAAYAVNLPISEELRAAGEKLRLMRMGVRFADGLVVAVPDGFEFANVASQKGRRSFIIRGGEFGSEGHAWGDRFALADELMSESHTFAEQP